MLLFIVAEPSAELIPDANRRREWTERTLRSVCAQASPEYYVFFVCARKPDACFTHDQMTILEDASLTDAPPEIFLRRALIEVRRFAPCHVMRVMAGDWVHANLAEHSAWNPETPGWVLTRGYTRREGSCWVRKCRDFSAHSDTSIMLWCDPAELPCAMVESGSAAEQILLGDLTARRGLDLQELPFAGGMTPRAAKELHSVSWWERLKQTRYLTPWLRRDFNVI